MRLDVECFDRPGRWNIGNGCVGWPLVVVHLVVLGCAGPVSSTGRPGARLFGRLHLLLSADQ